MRLFLWRACKNFILVRSNLSRRGLGNDQSCPICGFGNETVVHALVICPAMVASWFVSPLGLRCDQMSNGSFSDWFVSLKVKLDREQMCVAAIIVWCIWNIRNSAVHGDKVPHPAVGVARSLCYFSDFKSAQLALQPALSGTSSARQTCWKKPPPTALKVNCDASVKSNDFVGIGFVIRDSVGKVFGASIDRVLGDVSVDCAEALAIRSALRFAKECMLEILILESDSKRLIDFFNSDRI